MGWICFFHLYVEAAERQVGAGALAARRVYRKLVLHFVRDVEFLPRAARHVKNAWETRLRIA